MTDTKTGSNATNRKGRKSEAAGTFRGTSKPKRQGCSEERNSEGAGTDRTSRTSSAASQQMNWREEAETARPAAVGRTLCEEPAEANKPKTPHAPPRAIPRRDRPPSRGSRAFRAERLTTGRSEHRPQQREPAVHEIRMATRHPVTEVTDTQTGSNATNRKGRKSEAAGTIRQT